jgi:hypothetical protein
MHRRNQNRNREQEIEQRLKKIISEAKPVAQKRSRIRKILSTSLLCLVAVVLTCPLWARWENHSQATQEPVYYRIKKVSVEYPEGLEPTIHLAPAKSKGFEPTIHLAPTRSGCAFMPETKNYDSAKTI